MGKSTKFPSIAQTLSRFARKYLLKSKSYKGKIMQFVKPVNNQSRWILDQIFPGRADFLMQKTANDRMEAVATYLAQQIKVKNKSFIMASQKIFEKYSEHLNDILYNTYQIFQNNESRLPLSASSLRPDCSTINLAETSDQPEAWLFHPTGITFKFDVKKL